MSAAILAVAASGAGAWYAWNRTSESGRNPVVAARTPSVAVLSFADLSPGHDHEYFADGMAEEVMNGLAQVAGLRVVGRSTAFSYKGKGKKVEEVGRELGVDAVLEGSVRKSGNDVRITVQLVRAGDASTIWSRSFDGNLSNAFAVQSEIGRAVVDALAVRLVPGQTLARSGGTTNADAIQLYLKGRDLLRKAGPGAPKAWEAFEQAVKLDPQFALAWVGIADAVLTIEVTLGELPTDAPDRRRRAWEAADRAIALAPTVADGFRTRADLHQWLVADWASQRKDLERARALAPGDAAVALTNGMYLLAVGRLDEAMAEMERSIQLDPLIERGWVNGWLGLLAVAYSRRDHAKVRDAASRLGELFPSRRNLAGLVVAMDRIVAGEPRDALETAAKFRKRGGGDQVYALFFEALAYHDLGQTADAMRARDELVRQWGERGAPYQVAEVFAWQGDADGAFAWLEKARTLPDSAVTWMKTDPLLQKIRSDPRWPALLERAGLPPD